MLSLGSRLLHREKDLQSGINVSASDYLSHALAHRFVMCQVTEACAWAYESNPSGLGPEQLTFFSPDEEQRYHVVTFNSESIRGHKRTR